MIALRTLLPLAFLLLCSVAQAETMAIVEFANNTGDEKFDALGRGLQDMLTTDLSHVEGIDLVERARLAEILGELELQQSDFVDPATAARMGKGVGAKWVLTGGVSAIAPEMRLDARVVDVGTSKVVAATEITGAQDEFFLLEKELVAGLLEELDVTVSARESMRIGRVQTESFDAFFAWSEGLDALDAGEVEDAAAKLKEALEHDDRFGAAESALGSLAAKLEVLESKRVTLYDAEAKRVLAELDKAAKAKDWPAVAAIVEPLMSQSFNLSLAERRSISDALIEMSVPEEQLINPDFPGGISVNQWAVFNRVDVAYRSGERGDTLTWGETFLERYPTSMWHAAVKNYVDQVMNRIAEDKEAKTKAKQAIEAAWFRAHAQHCTWGPNTAERAAACEAWVKRGHAAKLIDDDDVEDWVDAAEDARDAALIKKAGDWAAAHSYPDEAKRALSKQESLQRDLDRYADTDFEAKLAEADSYGDYTTLARRAWEAGHEAQAWELIETGQRALPGELKLWDWGWDTAEDVLDLERAKQYTAGAAKAGLESYQGERVIAEIEKDIQRRAAVPAYELRERAIKQSSAKLYVDSSQSWESLAKGHPDWEVCDAPCALQNAAGQMFRAMVPGQNDRQRALYQRILDEYPDSEEAKQAKTVLNSIPR